MLKKMNYTYEDIKLLINDCFDLTICDDEGKNLFFYINDIKSFHLLINRNIDLNKKDIYGNSALFTCNSPTLMKEMLKYLPINNQNKMNRTALFYVNVECSKILLENGIDVNIKDSDGNTVFLYNSMLKNHIEDGLYTFKDGKSEKFKLLVDFSNDINIKNNKNENILHVKNYFREDDINILFKKGLDFNVKEIYGERNILERYPYLIKYLSPEMVGTIDFSKKWFEEPMLFSLINEFKHLASIKKIKNINVLNSKNETILFYIKESYLLKKVVNNFHFDINSLNLNKENVLFSDNMTSDKIRFLCGKNANFNQQNINNQTPLEYHLDLYNKSVKEKDNKSKYKKKYFQYIENVKELLSITHSVPLQYIEEEPMLNKMIKLRMPVELNKESIEKQVLSFIIDNNKPKLKKRL